MKPRHLNFESVPPSSETKVIPEEQRTAATRKHGKLRTAQLKLSDAEFKGLLLNTLRSWVDSHPAPDEPAISVANFGQFSPRRIYNEVDEGSEFGKFFLRLVEHGATVASLDEVLAGFSPSSHN